MQFPTPPITYLPTGLTLIGIHGKAGSGKDTVASYVHREYEKSYIEHFADPLKEAAAKMFGIHIDDFYEQPAKETRHGYWRVSPREIAQFMGTEFVRNMMGSLIPDIGNDFWLRRMFYQICTNGYNGEDTLMIPDLRFQNEYSWIISQGGYVIHLTRPGADGNVGIPGHSSESDLILHTKERTYELVNDGSLDDLYVKVDDILSDITTKQSAV